MDEFDLFNQYYERAGGERVRPAKLSRPAGGEETSVRSKLSDGCV